MTAKKPRESASYRLMKETFLDSLKRTLRNLKFEAGKTVSILENSLVYRAGDEEIVVPTAEILKGIGLEISHREIGFLKTVAELSDRWRGKLEG